MLIKLIHRPIPYNLDEVRLINCKIAPQAVQYFIQEINGSNLRKLSLVKCEINKTLFEGVLDLIENSYNIIDLDISWNKLRPLDMRKLFKTLSTNRQL